MSLQVETGEGLPDADSYVSVEEADAYHAKFGNMAWEEVEDKEIALRKATRDFDLLFKLQGLPATDTQSLQAPTDALEGIPKRLKDAVCELALIGMTLDLTGPVAETQISEQSSDVFGLKKTTKYFQAEDTPQNKALRRIRLLVGSLLDVDSAESMYVKVAR